MTNKEVMQMALDAITDWGVSRRKVAETVEALRTALAQPEPELGEQYSDIVSDGGLDPRNKLQREWVGLTDDEYELMAEKRVTNYFFNTLDYAHDIEAKLKGKNT